MVAQVEGQADIASSDRRILVIASYSMKVI
jgi:hypothetical protein